MSGTHGVFQHRTGYFYTILEEDFCEMYKAEGVNEVCRAYITSILENLTNKQFDGTGNKEEIWVYISLPEMARRMRHAYSERTIHKEVQGMIKDEYLKKRRAINKATMEYCLNLEKIRDGLASLPDKQSCNSARSNLAILQDQPCNSATTTLQFCNNDLAELQPRITNRINKEETKEEESICNEHSVEQLAPNVALSPTSQSSLTSFPQEQPQEGAFHIDELATRNDQSIEQKPLMPDLPPKSSSKKKEMHTEPLAPKEAPKMPAEDMAWGTKKCLLMFDAWRGHILIGYYKLSQASTCAKGLTEQYTEEEVRRVYQSMSEDAFWQEKGLDICNVANNIHKKIKKVKTQKLSTQTIIVDMDAERERARIKNEQQLAKQREMQRKRAELAKQGVNNG